MQLAASEPHMPKLDYKSVTSSNIDGLHYDEGTQTLNVRFKNGGRYAYGGVAKDAFEALRDAESVGKHFHQHIRGGEYKFTKHTDEE
jgi:hypothetical protein